MTRDEIVALAQSPWVKSARTKRRALTPKERQQILRKTGGCCHVCGGRVDPGWQADHVVPHAHGGTHSVENYLPICATCNRIRWFYSPDVFRLIMQLGVYAKEEIRRGSALGHQIAERAAARLRKSAARRRPQDLDKPLPNEGVVADRARKSSGCLERARLRRHHPA